MLQEPQPSLVVLGVGAHPLKSRLCLWGTFRLFAPDGQRVEIPSRKGMALLAMLGTGPGGERTRVWLQDRLWGSRPRAQAQQNLRRELSLLRAALPDAMAGLVSADRDRVRLNLGLAEMDEADLAHGAVFLDGFDIAGEDGFEDWLRSERLRMRPTRPAHPVDAPSLPETVVNLSQPPAGFGGRPALAILPFANDTADPEWDVWAEGMTEDLIERMSRLRWLPVIAPATAAALGHRNLDALSVGTLVGAAYVMRGRLVQRNGPKVLNLSLLDGQTGQILWSERITLAEGVTQSALEEVAHQLVATLEGRIDAEEQVRVISRAVDELTINERVWRARWHLNRLTREDAALARTILDRALVERPHSADVLIQAAFAKAWEIWSGRMAAEAIQEMRALAQRAVAADAYDARGYMLAGMAEMWLRRHGQAEALFLEALQINPSLARAYAQLGSNYYLSGRPELALEPLHQSLRLSPLDHDAFYILGEIAVSHCMMEHWADAVRHADLSIARRPAYVYAHAIKVNALVRSDRAAAARKALAALYGAKPGFLSGDLDWLPFREPLWNSFLKEGIALAEGG